MPITLPNMLSLFRLLAVPVLIVSLAFGWQVAGFIIFVAASVSDFFDGYFARKWDLVSDLGILIDTVADKVLVAAALICLVSVGAVSAWIVVVILSREFLVTGLRSLAASRGVLIAAGKSGKVKAIFQYITISVLLLHEQLAPLLSGPFTQALLWITVALTLFSGVEYFYNARYLFAEAATIAD
jgi:CDP-diacylglycerol--glycerol-3-phosphate 3-phosphatidyltransferase